ncbi:MAG: histidine kinase [Planctomycetes bacterium]|nr:histidine kinase [Planctomycetota bacterium]
MKDPAIDKIVSRKDLKVIHYDRLMSKRVHNILLVSSLYDYYTITEDAVLNEVLFSEYLELNLRQTPQIERVSTAEEAINALEMKQYDLLITIPRVGSMNVVEFGRTITEKYPDLTAILMTYDNRELRAIVETGSIPGIDKVFVWNGDVRIFLAIIKYVEDKWNAEEDAKIAGVNSIILIEDSPRFYSSYLALLYTELVEQTQALMAEGVNRLQKLLRMRARPKVLLVNSYEDAMALFEKNEEFVLGVITDAAFPMKGKHEKEAGIKFTEKVKAHRIDIPILMQSSDETNRKWAEKHEVSFINKRSPTLLTDVRAFMREKLGFGDFVFRHPNGEFIDRATDLSSMAQKIKTIPDDSLFFHGFSNHFSRWLMARTEFELASILRAKHVEDFDNSSEIREFLRKSILTLLKLSSAGMIEDFSVKRINVESKFMKIGNGSLGGKGRGLAFINSLLNNYHIDEHIINVRIFVPNSLVLTTEIFDLFMEKNELISFVMKVDDDFVITEAFLNSKIPDSVKYSLRSFLLHMRKPIAVRSSSLLEDSSFQPFAGVYKTYMIPNNNDDVDVRLEELCNAIKLVYASTYYSDSKSYIESTPNRLEEEKMAVIIQEIVGKVHDDHLYPNLAGVGRSHDYYPMEGMNAEDGVVSVALGLGKTVVDGGLCVRFSPEYPKKLYQFSSTKDYLDYAQREFLALNMKLPGPPWDEMLAGKLSTMSTRMFVSPKLGRKQQNMNFPRIADYNINKFALDVAEKDETLHPVGSVYSQENDAVYDGISRQGVRLVTMSGILKYDLFPLAETMKFLFHLGNTALGTPVEIEFAVNLKDENMPVHELGFLQIRPLVVGETKAENTLENVNLDEVICFSNKALGHGFFEDIRDIIYVKPENFNRTLTETIAREVSTINAKLKKEDRTYILIGQGRWGTADRWLGIPVSWSDISNVRFIVETDMQDISVKPSQGTHFFQNITSLGIGYFTVNFGNLGGKLDYDWLNKQKALNETEHVRHVRFKENLRIVIDGSKGTGAILKNK